MLWCVFHVYGWCGENTACFRSVTFLKSWTHRDPTLIHLHNPPKNTHTASRGTHLVNIHWILSFSLKLLIPLHDREKIMPHLWCLYFSNHWHYYSAMKCIFYDSIWQPQQEPSQSGDAVELWLFPIKLAPRGFYSCGNVITDSISLGARPVRPYHQQKVNVTKKINFSPPKSRDKRDMFVLTRTLFGLFKI